MGLFGKIKKTAGKAAKTAYKPVKQSARSIYGSTVGKAGGPSLRKVARTAWKRNPIYGMIKTTKALNKKPKRQTRTATKQRGPR